MKYAKFFAAIAATVLAAVYAANSDGGVTVQEWVTVAIAGVGALSVYQTPNVPGFLGSKYSKAIVAALSAVLALLANVILGGVDTNEAIQLVLVGLGAVGVWAVPNKDAGVNISNYGDLGR